MEQKLNSSTEVEANNVKPHLHKTPCCTLPFVQLWNEDCLETLKRIETGSIDLMLTDPPYGTTQCDWDNAPNFAIMWQEWERILKPNGAFVFFGSQPFTTHLISSRLGFFKYEMIWEKTMPNGFLDAQKKPLKCHENILVFYRQQPTYNPQKTIGKKYKKIRKASEKYEGYNNYIPSDSFNDGDRFPTSIITYSNGNNRHDTGRSIHPTQKPLELIRYLLNTYSNENDLVFDGYSGSGTTAAACIKERRNFIGSELNKEYFDLSVKRLTEISMKPELELR